MKIEVTLSREWKTSELRHVMMALARGPMNSQVSVEAVIKRRNYRELIGSSR